ncbi:MAG: TIM barrel protein [Chloroflexota bacterium]
MSDLTGTSGIRVAAAPVSWGVFEQADDDPMQLTPDVMLDQMAAAGYAGTELGPPGYFGDAAQVRQRLSSRRLSLVGAFLPQRFSRAEHAAADRAWMCEVLDLMTEGQPDEVKPKAILADASLEPERMRWAGQIHGHPEAGLPPARFEVLIDNLHRAGEAALERGYDPVLHFHAGSYIESDAEIHAVFDRLDPALVGMCLDTGHARFAGVDPTQLLADYAAVVRHVHIKDCDLDVLADVVGSGGGLKEAWARGVFCELGHGSSGLAGFLDKLVLQRYEGWLVVEQDRFLTSADTAEALLALHTRNREWLVARGF